MSHVLSTSVDYWYHNYVDAYYTYELQLCLQICTKSTHTTCLTALFPGLPGWASTRKVKPIWILLKQETVSGNGISWAICKSAPCSRQITTPAPHHSVFYRPDALPATQPTASKHWRHLYQKYSQIIHMCVLLLQHLTQCSNRALQSLS